MSQTTTDAYRGAYHQVRFSHDPGREKVWRAICGYLQTWVDETQPLLDLGAGYGEFCRNIRSSEKWALDLNPELPRYWGDQIRPLIQPALTPLPIPDGHLGTVFASNFFEHFLLEEATQILDEVHRVLRPGGRLIVVQPNFRLEPRRYFDDFTHRTAFTDEGFSGLLQSRRFNIVRSEPRFTPFTMKSRWPKATWMVRLYLQLPYRPMAGQFLVVAGRGED